MAAVAAELVGAARLAAQAPLTEPGPRIRAFFAIALPGPQREELSRYLEACAAASPEFRWAVHENLHLTLRFVGSVDREVAERIAGSLAAQAGPAFQVALGEVGTFKRGRLVRVVWLGVREGVGPMRRLADLLERECRAAGLEPEARPFKPHLTLARARPRDGAPLTELPPPPKLEPWRAHEVVLFSSHLGRDGAVHEPIRAVALGD